MKVFILVLLCVPMAAFGQRVNDTITYGNDDLILQNTDVYYYPLAPPAPTDTREQLSCIAAELRDPDGKPVIIDYLPMTHDTILRDWRPYGRTIGDTIMWMRLFSANRKANGSASDIIAGRSVTNLRDSGNVTVSALEDVDFRASGTVKLEPGFHVMPGAFFHAYIEPKWGTGNCASAGDSGNALVFCDEFTEDTMSQWFNPNGWDASSVGGSNCALDSNIHSGTVDAEALDGHAVQIDLLAYGSDSCECTVEDWYHAPGSHLGIPVAGCSEAPHGATPIVRKFEFSTGVFLSCPFPFKTDTTPWHPAYEHSPYGKYEVREKIPQVPHHTNNWGDGQSDEWNLDEMWNATMDQIHPMITHRFLYGPYKGKFATDKDGKKVFISSQPQWSGTNHVAMIVIDGFPYECAMEHPDSVYAASTTANEGGFPSSLTGSSDSVTFFYRRDEGNQTDSLHWSVSADGRYFNAPYKINGGDSLFFTKAYQPVNITLRDSISKRDHTYSCHWDHITGRILFDPPIPDSLSHGDSVGFGYTHFEGPLYTYPGVHFDSSGYRYHTFAMEFLPHEVRFLVDGNVVRRFPDRLVPPTDQRRDYITRFPRTPMNVRIAQLEIDGGLNRTDYGYVTEKAYFDAHGGDCLGCWDVRGHHAAHHMVDYVKIWDLPTDYIVPSFPR